MIERTSEDKVSITPKPDSPTPEIFSSKKIFFLNSSRSGSHRSEIPHIESDYCPRDEVSRRLFHNNSDSCDCDCSSDGCWGCLRRNKQCFFKFFVLALSIILVLLLFGSLSYNLTRQKGADNSFEFDKTEYESHYHEYPALEEKELPKQNATTSNKIEPVLDSPVPFYEHSDDYDSSEDLRRLQYHLDENPDRGHDPIEPISFPVLNTQKGNSQNNILIIYDGREPPRTKRSLSSKIAVEKSGLSKRKAFEDQKEVDPGYESLLEEVNEIEEGMEKFWESYFKKGKTVFEPFSLNIPLDTTPMQSGEYSMEEEIEDHLKKNFLNQATPETLTPVSRVTEKAPKDSLAVDWTSVGTRKMTTLRENFISELTDNFEESSPATEKQLDYTSKSSFNTETSASETSLFTENEALNEITETDVALEEATLNREAMNTQIDHKDVREFRTWPLYHFSVPLAGLFGSSQQDQISAEAAPLDTVKGISLADAKKIKKERRKHMLLNSKVVGGSSDVRLPTGSDVSKPFVNAFETLKTNQQLSFTPSAASQFILPYQMCLFAGPFTGFRSPVHGAQPRTFSFGAPPLIPSILDKGSSVKNPYQAPTQQNFLSFSINNFPNAPSYRQPIQPTGGSVFNFPPQQQFSQYPGPNRQPIFCTYLQPPLFQFPTVPGTADFSHAKCVDCQEDVQKEAPLAKELVLPSGRETLCADGKVACMDGSSCITVDKWCDNQVHCKDASDEAFCSCRERVASDRLCDGYVDCPHGEDEIGCFDCPKSAFSCDSVISPRSCIPLSKRCDGVTDCATGVDEVDCSAIFFDIHQNNSYRVPQVIGYLHRNWRGDWFPVCVEIGDNVWAKEACLGELGALPSNVEVRFNRVSGHYRGPFIVRKGDGTIGLQDHCKGHVSTFVKCPAMSCGTRVELHSFQRFESRLNYHEEIPKNDPKTFELGENLTTTLNTKFSEESKLKRKIEDLRLKREETGRVVGGRESEPRAWPWAIAVYKNGAFHCGGVILDEKWVLTAAHCMEQYWKHYYEVRGGMLRRFSFSAMEQARTVSDVIIHENYDLTIMSSDLALLRLREPFYFNRWIRPACLPVLQDGISKFASGPAPGTRCTAVGWGALKERGTDPDQLREVEIPILTRCKHKEDLVGEEICAGKTEGGKDTCQGDSGGPLLCRDSGSPASWYIAGIVSHGEGCARPGEPGAYTRISLFVDWITANTNDFQLPSVKPLQSCPGFLCRSASRLCIPLKWVCNGYTDCLEAEDERNCTFDSSASNAFGQQYFSTKHKNLELDDFESSKLSKHSSAEVSSFTISEMSTFMKTESQKEKILKMNEGLEELKQLNEKIRSKEVKEFSSVEQDKETTKGLKSFVTFSESDKDKTILTSSLPLSPLLTSITATTTTIKTPAKIATPTTTSTTLTPATTITKLPPSIPTLTTSARITTTLPSSSPTSAGITTTPPSSSPTSAGITTTPPSSSPALTSERIITTPPSPSLTLTTSEKTLTTPLSPSPALSTSTRTTTTSPSPSSESTTSTATFIATTAESFTPKTTEQPAVSLENADVRVLFSTEGLPEMTFLDETTKDEKQEDVKSTGCMTDECKKTEISESTKIYEEITGDIVEEKKHTSKSVEENKLNDRKYQKVGNTSENKDEEREYGENQEIENETDEVEESKEKKKDKEGGKSSEKIIDEEEEKQNTEGIDSEEEATVEKESTGTDEEKITSVPSENWNKIDDSSITYPLITDYLEGSTKETLIYTEEEEEKEAKEVFTTDVNVEEHEETKKSSAEEEMQTELKFTESVSEPFATTEPAENRFWTDEFPSTFSGFESPETEFTEDVQTERSTLLEHLIRTRETDQTSRYYLPEDSTTNFDSASTTTDAATSEIKERPSEVGGSEYFQCRLIVQSVLASYVCDGVEDCEDGTDEENCTCVQTLRISNPQLICNGKVDCPDHSDEKNCSACLSGEFRCKMSEECIPLQDRCDGTFNCKSGEDEAKCMALAKNGEVRLHDSGDPLLETEGVLIVNKNGLWSVKCQEETAFFAAGEAIEICSSLRTIGYERYENQTVDLNCTGFHVTCARNLISSVERYQSQGGSYLWPWNAYVYSDGQLICFAVLLQPQWLLTSSRCLKNVSLKKNYLVAKLGSRNWASKIKEEDSETVRIDGAHVIPESEAVLLHLAGEVNQTDFVRSLGIPYAFDSDPKKDLCMAVGDRTVFLKISEQCPETSRCYKRVSPVPSGCSSKPWAGVIVCQSTYGWYPSSVFFEQAGHCGFKHVKFTSLEDNLKLIYHALGKKVDIFPEPFCSGFRCSQGLCIPESKKCNGWPDCSSEEDETLELCSLKRMKECKVTELKCRNGLCIPKVLFGDGINDCGDESDEPRNATCVEYLRLTSPERICDGRRNCFDKTDEDYKLCSCTEHKFQCRLSGYCIPRDFVCDDEKDCPGGEDEEQCMGRKFVKNNTRTHLEVMQKSYGIWHTVCPSRISKERSDALCRDLGFKKASFTYERNQTVVVPKIDAFSWVKLNRKTSIALRGDKPFVKLFIMKKTCGSVKCT